MANSTTNGRPFRILSLDGGGIRGAFVAGFLNELESRLSCRVGEYFDLIAGTSTGGIVAAGVALREPASKIERFYRSYGARIFTRRPALKAGPFKGAGRRVVDRFLKRRGYQLDCDQLHQSKYTSEVLREALIAAFDDKTLEAAQNRLVIPAVDLTRGQTIVFKTPHLPDLFRDREYKIVDVLLATTAAPTYFPHAVIGIGSAYVDGGLWANNPSLVAIAEAHRILEKAGDGIGEGFDLGQINLLSVGTGRASYFAQPPTDGAGALWWLPHILDVSSVSQSQGINFQAKYMLGDRAHRVDYDLPDGTWSLDSVNTLEEMIRIGHEKGVEMLKALRPTFFESKACHPYRPYPKPCIASQASVT